MSASGAAIQPGMEVFGCDAEHVGQVSEIRSDGLLVRRAKGSDLTLIPKTVVAEVSESEHRVDLSVTARAVNSQEWSHPTV